MKVGTDSFRLQDFLKSHIDGFPVVRTYQQGVPVVLQDAREPAVRIVEGKNLAFFLKGLVPEAHAVGRVQNDVQPLQQPLAQHQISVLLLQKLSPGQGFQELFMLFISLRLKERLLYPVDIFPAGLLHADPQQQI
jgi:hypothetical protein